MPSPTLSTTLQSYYDAALALGHPCYGLKGGPEAKHSWHDIIKGIEELEEPQRHEEFTLTSCPLTGDTLAHVAAKHGNVELFKALIRKGFQCRKRNKMNRLPLDIASMNKDEQMKTTILDLCYTPSERLFYLREKDSNLMKQLFIETPSAINDRIPGFDNATWASHLLSEARMDDFIWLCDHGADLLIIDGSQGTIFHHLVLGGPPPNLLCDQGNEDDYKYPWMIESHPSSLSYNLEMKDNSLDSIMIDSSLSVAEKTSLQLLDYILNWRGGALHDYVLLKNESGDGASTFFAETATSPSVLCWALRMLMRGRTALNCVNELSGLNVAMIVASRFGSGPWLDWIIHSFYIDPDDRSLEGLTINDYIKIWRQKMIEERTNIHAAEEGGDECHEDDQEYEDLEV